VTDCVYAVASVLLQQRYFQALRPSKVGLNCGAVDGSEQDWYRERFSVSFKEA
jgi:hypothetical protein